MSNTQTHPLLRIVASSFVVAGMVLLIASHSQRSYAQQIDRLSDQGSLVVTKDCIAASTVENDVLLLQGSLHGAAPDMQNSTSGSQIVLGALLLLMGFVLHAVIVLRKREGPKPTGPVQQSMEFYWMEIRK